MKKFSIKILLSFIFLVTLTHTTELKATISNFDNYGTKFAKLDHRPEMFFFKQNADTVVGSARITVVWTDIQQIKVKLQITQNRETTFRLSLFNLLGKEVKVIYEGLPRDNDYEYTSSIADLPNGVYICILSSSNYKDAKKIVISR